MSGYFINIRMEWIHESLRVYGYINRSHVMAKYGGSNGNAALDFKEFLKRFPGYCTYNTKTMRYELSVDTCQGRHEKQAAGAVGSAGKEGTHG